MFIGSIDKPSRIMCDNLLQVVDKHSKTEVYVGCSGNFTFDRIAAARGFNVHSNDVSLYSRVIAGIVQKERFPFTCTNPMLNSVFADWDDSPQADLVKVMFAAKVGKFVSIKNDFERTMLDNYLAGAGEFFQGTMDKFQRNDVFSFEIGEFFFGDFKEHIARAGENALVFLYAPTYKGGYEKLFQFIEESFDYERPEYELFDSREAGPYYQDVLTTKEACVYSDVLYPEIAPFLKGEATYIGNKKTVYLYSSIREATDAFYLTESEKLLERTPKPISPDLTEPPETTELSVVPCKVGLVNHYKHLYMSSRVDYSTGGDFALAFLMGDRVFGFASFASGLGTMKDGEYLFLHSDFVVPSGIERLSKLLLYLLRSKETRTLLMRYYVHAYKGLQTSVYTARPVSMKYRGPFKKVERNGDPKNKLTYVAEFTTMSLTECFERWLKRQPLQ